jgi:polyhydroxyalkanoate synthesis regulator phasin
MNDVISRALFCGLGLASLTKDAIQKTVEDLVKQSKISEEEGRRLVKDLQRRSKQAQKALEKQADAAVQKMFQDLDVKAIISGRLKAAKPAVKKAKKAKKARPGAAGKTHSR